MATLDEVADTPIGRWLEEPATIFSGLLRDHDRCLVPYSNIPNRFGKPFFSG